MLAEWWEGRKVRREFVVMVKGKASDTIKKDLQYVCVCVCIRACMCGV